MPRLSGEGSHTIDALLMGIMDPNSFPPSIRPHSSGFLVVEQSLPVKGEGELEAHIVGFVFGNCTLLHHIDLYICIELWEGMLAVDGSSSKAHTYNVTFMTQTIARPWGYCHGT